MTVISMTSNFGMPVLMGDILISSQNGTATFSLPTLLNGIGEEFGNTTQYLPIGLKQKLSIINDQLCVALGGRLDQIYSFNNALYAAFCNHIPDNDELEKFLHSYDKEKSTHLTSLVLLAIIKKDEITFRIHHLVNWLSEKNEELEHIYVAGSGALHFIEQARIKGDGSGYTNFFNKALVQNLQLLSNFIGLETTTANSILENWGAGYELVYFFKKFKKLDDFSFIVFDGRYIQKNKLLFKPIGVYKYKYFGNRLIIRGLYHFEWVT